jgi:hypothetical protein
VSKGDPHLINATLRPRTTIRAQQNLLLHPVSVKTMSICTTAALPGTGSLSSADFHLQERTVKAGFEVLGFGS